MEDYRLELQTANGERFFNVEIMPLINRAHVYIYNRSCNRDSKYIVDLSGTEGSVAAFAFDFSGEVPYQLPKWVKTIVKKELEKIAD